MSDKFNMLMMLDWGTENIRWSLGGEIFSMHNEFPPPPGILFNDPERMAEQLREVIGRSRMTVPWYRRIIKPKILAAVPLGISGIETIGFHHILKQEAWKALLIEVPMAIATGCGYFCEEEKPFGILELGAGFAQFAVIQQGGIQASTSLRRGGRDLDTALKRYLKRQLHAEPSEAELAAVKHNWNRHETLRLDGVSVKRDALWQIYTAALIPLVEALQDALDSLSPKMTSALKADGIQMTGGLAKMPQLAEYLTGQTGFPFRPAKNPEQAVMRGLFKIQTDIPPKLWR